VALRLRVEGEIYQYDTQDSAVFFNYQVVRARLGPRYEANGWLVTVGPLAELLHSAANPSEEYRQICRHRRARRSERALGDGTHRPRG
jgi:hypothetical protein